jgi:diguanylate cyclase (GGDEF)-like protein
MLLYYKNGFHFQGGNMIKPQSTQMDELTGFFNRKAFMEEFQNFLAKARSQAVELPLSLALFDLDHFKRINDVYGHVAGDNVLIQLARVIQEAVGEKVICARYGGDEFAILFVGQEREQAFLILEQIRAAVVKITVEANEAHVIEGLTTSAGVASFPVDGRSEVELLRKADQALYRAKWTGRNQVRLAYEERMVPKTAHFTQTQLERLANLAESHGVSEADMLREAMDDLLTKYGVNDVES